VPVWRHVKMAPLTSNVWSPGESSLKRSSFNALVEHKKADVPEILTRAQTMGRQAEFGPGWTPSALVARRIADGASQGATMVAPPWQSISLRQSPQSPSMSRRQRSQPAGPSSPQKGFFRDRVVQAPKIGTLQDFLRKENTNGLEVSGETNGGCNERDLQPSPMASRFKPISMGPPKMAWGSMMPKRPEGLRQASAPTLLPSNMRPSSSQSTSRSLEPGYASTFNSTACSPGVCAVRPVTAPDGLNAPRCRANRSTTVWKPSEMSLGRDHLNAIVRGATFDVPEAMMRQTSMGRQAEFGPEWVPPGVLARQMADLLTNG